MYISVEDTALPPGQRWFRSPRRTRYNAFVFTGKRFRLKTPVLAVDETAVQRTAVTLPPGSVINVIDGPKPDNPLLSVVCENRWLLMFEQDIRDHAEEMPNE